MIYGAGDVIYMVLGSSYGVARKWAVVCEFSMRIGYSMGSRPESGL
jgi:hypothetical protein